MTLYAYLEGYGNLSFPIEVGGTYRKTITDSLDSFVCNIVNTPTNLKLFPFQFVRIVDRDNYEFSKLFVLDNFTQEELLFANGNTYKKHYEYTLNLMSPTKLLDKIILPNRTILHSNIYANRTIGQVIDEMCSLYLPKRKVKNDMALMVYTYQPIFNFDFSNDSKFDVECPDLSWNAPSLREVLKTLMLYVGCLPKVENYTITYIDLRANKVDFEIPLNKQFFVKKSNSSDSYINTIISPSKNVVDKENKTIHQHLGFRDNDSVFLKAEDNLILTTDFPIKEINSFIGNFVAGLRVSVKGTQDNHINLTIPVARDNVTFEAYNDIENVLLTFVCLESANYGTPELYGEGIKQQETLNLGNIYAPYSQQYSMSIPAPYTYVKVEYTYNNKRYVYNSLLQNNTGVETWFENFVVRKFDLTDLVKETQVANQLETDYTKLSVFNTMTPPTWEVLTSNYYSALEYTYNTNKITGFSKKFSEFQWAGNQDYVLIDYLECVMGVSVGLNDTQSITETLNYYGISVSEFESEYQNNATLEFARFFPLNQGILARSILDIGDVLGYRNGMSSYGLFYFDIDYVPFNSLNAKYHKQTIPFEIEQIDTQENGISVFELVSANKQQSVNRLGNDILQIFQPQAQMSEINDIYNGNLVQYNDSVLFQQEIQFQTDFCEANYVGSKDYIMQNYFTALQFKYRAYEYVGTNESTIRKENLTSFVRIGRDYITNGTNLVYAPTYYFLASVLYQMTPLTYAIESGDFYTSSLTTQVGNFAKGLSILSNDNSLLLTYNDLLNTQLGTYIVVSQDQTSLGGLIQGRYIEGNDYYERHEVSFTNENIQDTSASFGLQEMVVQMNNTGGMPKYNFSSYVISLRNQNSNDNYGEDMSGTNGERIYYKSYEEKINETLQLEYYANESDIVFNKNFLLYHCLKTQLASNQKLVFRLINENALAFNDKWQNASYYDQLTLALSIPSDTNGVCKVDFDFADVDTKVVAICILDTTTFETLDLLMFDTTLGTTLYFSLNDTKTDLVFAYNTMSGMYEQSYKVVANNTDVRKRLIEVI